MNSVTDSETVVLKLARDKVVFLISSERDKRIEVPSTRGRYGL